MANCSGSSRWRAGGMSRSSIRVVAGEATKLSATQETHLVGPYRAGKHSTAELFSVCRSTIYRAVEHAGGTKVG